MFRRIDWIHLNQVYIIGARRHKITRSTPIETKRDLIAQLPLFMNKLEKEMNHVKCNYRFIRNTGFSDRVCYTHTL